MNLNVTGRSVLVESGSEAALSTVSALLREGARITVAAPKVCAALEDFADRGLVNWEKAATDTSDYDVLIRAEALGERELDAGVAPATSGQVTLVGAGPGDPGLVTVAGRAAIEAADVIVTDRLAPLEALKWAPSGAQIIDVSKIPHGRSTGQDEINRLLIDRARAGCSVVRFKGGDSFVFGRGFEEMIACAEAAIPTRVIPGVTSGVAGPAVAGIPVTHRGLVQGFAVVSGHVPPDHPDSNLDYAALARSGTTLVVLMGVRTLPEIVKAFLAGGLHPTTPCAVVADATLASQQVVRSTLGDVTRKVEAAGVDAPAVAVIGDVAGLTP